jgi:hypothetical protein
MSNKCLKLNSTDHAEWKRCEKIVKEGREIWYAVSIAWAIIAEKKYYLAAGFESFAEYAESLGYRPRGLYQRIQNAKVMRNLPEDLRGLVLNDSAARALSRAPKLLQAPIIEIESNFGQKKVSATAIKEHLRRPTNQPNPPREEDFYKPFAEWLKNMKECAKAIDLGGNRGKDRWATPDVVGTTVSSRGDRSHFPIEIVVAEIKTDKLELVTAFGQACAYSLFAHKSYLVIPEDASEDEIERIDALCQLFGIGLVTFDAKNPQDPDFKRRRQPTWRQPNQLYLHTYMERFGDVGLFS